MGCTQSGPLNCLEQHQDDQVTRSCSVVSPIVVAARPLPVATNARQLRPAQAAQTRSPKPIWRHMTWRCGVQHSPMSIEAALVAQEALMLQYPWPVLAIVSEFLCGCGNEPWRVAQPTVLRAVCRQWRDRIDAQCISSLRISNDVMLPLLQRSTSPRDRCPRRMLTAADSSMLSRVKSLVSVEIEPIEPTLVYGSCSVFLSFMRNLQLTTHLKLLPSQRRLDEGGFVFALAQVNALRECRSLQSVSVAKMALGSSALQSLLGQLGSAAWDYSILQLDLSSNNLNRSRSGTLEGLMSKRFHGLEALNMRGNWIGYSGAAELSRVANNLPQLTRLNLQSCCLDRQGARFIAAAMHSWPKLQELDLCNNFLSFRAVQELQPALSAAGSLTSLVLSRNAIGNAGLSVLSKALRNSAQLHSLALERCSLDDGCADTLASLLESTPNLRVLRLSDNSFSHHTMVRISRGLLCMKDLQEIHLRHCGVMDEGFRSLCTSLRHARHLHTLDIGSNSISGDGMQEIVHLHADCKLRNFNNRMNPIGNDGMSALASWLATRGEHLTHLQLSWNSLDAAGCAALSECISNLPELQELLMVGNVVGDAAGAALLASLRRGAAKHSLQSLDLSWNNLSDDAEPAIMKSIKSLRALHTLRIASNFLSPPAQRRIVEAGKQRSPPLLHVTLPL